VTVTAQAIMAAMGTAGPKMITSMKAATGPAGAPRRVDRLTWSKQAKRTSSLSWGPLPSTSGSSTG
jgi:hypothetical protein